MANMASDAPRSYPVHRYSTPAWKVSQANTLASLRGWTPFIGLSTQYSLVERTAERDILPMCADLVRSFCMCFSHC